MATCPDRDPRASTQALVQLCRDLAMARALPEMFEAVVRALVAATGCSRAAALAFDDDGVMRFRAFHGLSAGYRQAVEGHSPWSPDAGCPEPILVDDVARCDDLEALRPVLAEEGIAALAFLPLCGDGRLLGKFMLYADRPLDWRCVDLEFARAAADLLASFLLREAAQERLEQARRMESLGVLAGGIAHDFNNLLTSILGYADLIRSDSLRGTPVRGYVDELLRAVEQAAELTRQLLAFARPQLAGREAFDLGSLLAEVAPLLQRSCRPDHELRVGAPREPVPVLANRAQLHQLLWILVQHARHVSPAGSPIDLLVARRGSSMVEIAVRDLGPAMDENARRRAFEPSSTSAAGVPGGGLGLPTCYAMVQSLGGDIAVRSSGAVGTTLTVALPLASFAATEPDSGPVAEGATILVVEDQDQVMGALVRQLTALGHRVLTARNGRLALGILAERSVDVVVSDVVMPELGGFELARLLRARVPPVPVLLMTGFVDEPKAVPEGVPVLQKPFLPRELAYQLQQLLRARPTAGASGA
ncbi:MAG: response regulator [Planctomycetes bacterium]|nr:response regulator [Planctomycetota bacterium]